jgi:hypothetical protein
MTTAATSLLGLALPVTGELSGTWGDTVNNSITALLDSAVAGTTTLSADADVTLTTTTLAANQAREAIILWTAGGTVTRNITAPAQSKTYVVLNKTSSTQSIVIRGAGPTTGVTVLAGKQAMVAWDGTDFVEISSGYVDGPASSTDNAVARFDGTDGKTIQNSVVIIADTTGNMSGVGTLGVGAITTSGALVGAVSQDAFNTVSTTLNLGGAATTVNIGAATGTLTVANATLAAKAVTATAVTNSALTATRLVYSGTAGLEVDSANLTFNGTILTSTGFAGPLNGTVGATTANTGAFTTLSTTGAVTITGGTANGVAYLDGSKVLTTGTALTYDGSTFAVTGALTTTDNITVTKATGVPRVAIVASTGTNEAYFQAANTGGSYYFGAENSAGSWFGATAYALAISAPAGRVVDTLISGIKVTSLSSSGLEIKQSQLIGYSSYAGIGTYGLAVAGNVGVGTASPAQKLQVVGAIAATGQAASLTASSAFFDYVTSSNSARFAAVGNTTGTAAPIIFSQYSSNASVGRDAAIIDSTGNLGLGVTPSAWGRPAIQVGAVGTVGYYAATGVVTLSSNLYYGTGNKYITDGYASQYYQSSGSHVWEIAPSGTAGNNVSFTQAMTLDASGNLLVGATNAAVADSGADNLVVGPGTGNNGITIYSSNSGNANLNFADTDATTAGFIQYQHAGNNMNFRTNSAEAMRIDSSGNLLVGTTNPAYVTDRFSVVPTSSNATGIGIAVGNFNSVGLGIYNGYTATGTATAIEFKDHNSVTRGSITVSTTGTLYNVTSDQRLKENIQDAAPASALIDAIQVRQYDWKADGSHQRYGFVAQELVTVAPEAVHQPADPEEMMAVDYSKLVPMLVKEIQDLRKRLAAAGI